MNKTVYFLDTNPEDVEGYVWLNVTPEKHWRAMECQADFTEQEVIDELNKVGIRAVEVIEGVLEISENNLLQLLMFLEQHPDFIEDQGFTDFIKSFS